MADDNRSLLTGHARQGASTMPRTLWLGDYRVSRNQLSLISGVDDLRFATSFWYGEIDLLDLRAALGDEFFRKLVFHIAAFEANQLGSLAPDLFDLGPFSDLYTDRFATLWSTVFARVWAQWRYEHDCPDYLGPQILGRTGRTIPPVGNRPPSPIETLAMCGGGKDSLVALRLLERAGIPYASLGYAHSIYGNPEAQHSLLDRLLDCCQPRGRYRQWVYDDFLHSPVIALRPDFGARSLTAAETPSSVFGALPLMLAAGFKNLVVGHERSADTGNLVWTVTGEDVNHQWGKSLEAERLLNEYIRSELIEDVSYFSVLKPLYDVAIFALLTEHEDAVARTHSCNLRKPWCEECAKCAYVWINYMAYLSPDVVLPMFRTNLLDNPTNELAFRQMLGLEDHTPFECVGQVDEARLAFELCRRRGLRGQAMEIFEREVPAVDVAEILERRGCVDLSNSGIPAEIRIRLDPLLLNAQVSVEHLRHTLEQSTPDSESSSITLLIKPAEDAADQFVTGVGVATERVEAQISVSTR